MAKNNNKKKLKCFNSQRRKQKKSKPAPSIKLSFTWRNSS